MAHRFNPPPGWPLSADFVPPPGWQPDPSWPAHPEGWTFWVEREQPLYGTPQGAEAAHPERDAEQPGQWGTAQPTAGPASSGPNPYGPRAGAGSATPYAGYGRRPEPRRGGSIVNGLFQVLFGLAFTGVAASMLSRTRGFDGPGFGGVGSVFTLMPWIFIGIGLLVVARGVMMVLGRRRRR